MKLKNKLEVEETLEVGVIPNATTSNFSVVFETAGLFQRRQVGSIINKNDNEYLPSVSNAFPSSVFVVNASTTHANPNLTVSFVNQVAGTVFAAPQSLNGTPAFRMLQDSDLSQTTVFTKIGNLPSLTTTNKTTIVGAINEVNEKTNNIEIGGRNLILNSNVQGTITGSPSLNISAPLEPGQQYTLSFIAKKGGAGVGWVSVQKVNDWTADNLNARISVLNSEYQLIKITFTAKSTAVDQAIWIYSHADYTINFKGGIKLEKGNKATDWTPAPEDQVSDWSETDSTEYSFIKNKPTIPTSSDYITTDTNQTGLSGNKATSGSWYFAFRGNTYYNDDLGNPRLYFGNVASNINGIVFRNFDVSHQFQFRDTTNGTVVSINNDGLIGSTGGFSKTGATNADMLLGAGGHRPVSDFALAESLGNYLPLAGGTMNGSATINWVIAGQLAVAGNDRLRFTGTQTVLSGLVSSGQGIYFRPQGDTVTASQVSIQYDGQINTPLHGNSSQWKQAFGWGNHTGLYVPINGVTTINNTKTFTSSPIVPNATANNHAVNLGQLNLVESSIPSTVFNNKVAFIHLNQSNTVTNEVEYNNEAPLNIQFQDTDTVKITATTDGINTKYRFDSNASLITHDAPLDNYLAGGGNNAVKVICHIMNENIFQSPTDGNVLVNDAISLVGLWDDYRDKAVLRGAVKVNTSLQSYINAGKRYLVYYGEINSLGTQIDYQDCDFYTLIEIANMKLAVGEKNFIVKVGEIMSNNTIYVNPDLM